MVLLVSRDAAIGFASDKINLEALKIVVTANGNGTYLGESKFDDDDDAVVPTAAAKTAAKAAATAELNKPTLARLEISLKDDKTYELVST